MPFRREQAKVFLDRRCLLDGQNWIEGFVQGVTSSMVSTQKLSKSRRYHVDTPGLRRLAVGVRGRWVISASAQAALLTPHFISKVFMPLLSWTQDDRGAVGEMCSLGHADFDSDRVDHLLLECIIALQARRPAVVLA
jgi:hypothetical protein